MGRVHGLYLARNRSAPLPLPPPPPCPCQSRRCQPFTDIMLSSTHKIKKENPDALEESVAQALYELQLNSEKLAQYLREVEICFAKEIDVGGGRRAILVFVPVPQMPQDQKMIKERSLIEELEKKFSSKQVIIIAERRIIRKETRNKPQLKQKRPYSRTLTAVHADTKAAQDKLDVYIKVYKKMTGKDVAFEYRV